MEKKQSQELPIYRICPDCHRDILEHEEAVEYIKKHGEQHIREVEKYRQSLTSNLFTKHLQEELLRRAGKVVELERKIGNSNHDVTKMGYILLESWKNINKIYKKELEAIEEAEEVAEYVKKHGEQQRREKELYKENLTPKLFKSLFEKDSPYRAEKVTDKDKQHLNQEVRKDTIQKPPKDKKAKCFKWQGPLSEVEIVYDKLLQEGIIDISTDKENFKKAFSGGPAQEIQPIQWEDAKNLLAYFLSQLQANQKLSLSTNLWSTARNCFTNTKSLRQSKNGYNSNSNYKPKGFARIDSIIEEIQN